MTVDRAPRRDRSHYLYLAVLVAKLLGIAVGLLFPDFGVNRDRGMDAGTGTAGGPTPAVRRDRRSGIL